MANNFTKDPNCKALWRFEDGALTVDSKGGNVLSAGYSPSADADCKEGASSLFLNANGGGNKDSLYCLDDNLDLGFPGKSVESNKTFSIPFWVKFDELPGSGVRRQCHQKFASNDGSWRVGPYNNGSKIFIELLITADGYNFNHYNHASSIVTGRWYHITTTYDHDDYSYRIRIYDATAQAILGTDAVGTAVNMHIGADQFSVGPLSITPYNGGRLDEMVVFDDVLSVEEIDKISMGVYGTSQNWVETIDDSIGAVEVNTTFRGWAETINDSIDAGDGIGRVPIPPTGIDVLATFG